MGFANSSGPHMSHEYVTAYLYADPTTIWGYYCCQLFNPSSFGFRAWGFDLVPYGQTCHTPLKP